MGALDWWVGQSDEGGGGQLGLVSFNMLVT